MELTDYLARSQVLIESLWDLAPDKLPKIFVFFECYQRLVLAKSYAEVERIKKDFDKNICNSVWSFLTAEDQIKIKEMPR